jgi:hypothetical protein
MHKKSSVSIPKNNENIRSIGGETIDYRCEGRTKLGELRGDIGGIR